MRTAGTRDDRGQVTVFVVVFAAALVIMLGLVLDGGLVLAAQRRANAEADAAARAAASALDEDAYRRGEPVALDPRGAAEAVDEYLASTGHTGETSVSGDTVTVTVVFAQPLSILRIGGASSVEVTGVGRARLVIGLERERP